MTALLTLLQLKYLDTQPGPFQPPKTIVAGRYRRSFCRACSFSSRLHFLLHLYTWFWAALSL